MKFITPVVAAVLNVVGSLFVVFNSARLVREGEEFEIFDEEGRATKSKPEESSEADEPAPKFA